MPRTDSKDSKQGELKTSTPSAGTEDKPKVTPKKKVTGVRPHEAWAAEKGFMPAFTTVKGGAPGMSNKRENKKHWQYSAAMAGQAWVRGKEVSEKDFDAAIVKACGGVIR